MPTTTLTRTSTSTAVHRAGKWCLAAGIIGAIQAGIVLAWPRQVTDDRFSYPFTENGYAVAQVAFFLQHLPLIAGVTALLWLPPVRTSPTARIALRITTLGLTLLALIELVTISAQDAATGSDRATLAENLYGPPVILIGVGLLVAGAALLRQGTGAWVGARWMPGLVLLLGLYVFFPLTPAIMGTFTAGRLGIGAWMLLFAGLGYGLTQVGRPPGVRGARDHMSR